MLYTLIDHALLISDSARVISQLYEIIITTLSFILNLLVY